MVETGMKVKDIMFNPLMVDIGKSVKIAAGVMKKNRRYSVIATKKGNPVGILTDSDIIKKIVATNKTPSSVKISEVMSSPIVTISPGGDVLEAAEKMKKHKIKRLPVLKKGKIVGIIELSDVARASPEMADLLEYKIKLRDMSAEISTAQTSGICESCSNYCENLEYVADGRWLCKSCQDEMEDEY